MPLLGTMDPNWGRQVGQTGRARQTPSPAPAPPMAQSITGRTIAALVPSGGVQGRPTTVVRGPIGKKAEALARTLDAKPVKARRTARKPRKEKVSNPDIRDLFKTPSVGARPTPPRRWTPEPADCVGGT